MNWLLCNAKQLTLTFRRSFCCAMRKSRTEIGNQSVRELKFLCVRMEHCVPCAGVCYRLNKHHHLAWMLPCSVDRVRDMFTIVRNEDTTVVTAQLTDVTSVSDIRFAVLFEYMQVCMGTDCCSVTYH